MFFRIFSRQDAKLAKFFGSYFFLGVPFDLAQGMLYAFARD